MRNNSLTFTGYIEELKKYFEEYDTNKQHAKEIAEFLNEQEKYIKTMYDAYRDGKSWGNPNAFGYSLEMEFGLPWNK